MDSLEYLDPSKINGLNLYAYCLNNPVMYVDPSGRSVFLTMLLVGIGVGAVVGGTTGGIKAAQNGASILGGILGGAIMGGATGGLLVFGGAVGVGASAVAEFGLGSGLFLSAGVGIAAGWASYSVEAGINGNWNVYDFSKSGISGMLKGMSTFGIGFMGGKFLGGYDKMILDPLLKGVSTLDMNITYSFAKALMGRTMFLTPMAEFLLKTGLIGGAAAGVRWGIDWLLELF